MGARSVVGARASCVALACVGLIACAASTASKTPATPSLTPADAAQDASGAPAAAWRERGVQELQRAELELSNANNDCAALCRALGSMERATEHLCQLAASPEDRHACDDARSRLASSRAKVRNACGECSH